MNAQSYFDGVGEMQLCNGVTRMELLTMSPVRRDEDGNPIPVYFSQLLMSPETLLRTYRLLGAAVAEMRQKGILGFADAAPRIGTQEGKDAILRG